MTQTIAFGFLAGVLAIAAITDWRKGMVYNWLTYPAMIGGLAYWAVAGAMGAQAGLGTAVFGLLAALVPFSAVFLAGGLGGGDVKLMGAVGAISASWQCVLATTVYALIISLAMALFVMIRQGLVRRTLVRLWSIALHTAGRIRPELPSDSPRIAFSVAIALGGMVAAGEQLLSWQTPWRWLAP